MAKSEAISEHRPSISVSSEHPLLDSDEQMFRDLVERFEVLAANCYRFSREVYRKTGSPPEDRLPQAIEATLSLARTVFHLPLLEIVSVIYLKKVVRFQELQLILDRSSADELSTQLGILEALGLVKREVARAPLDRNMFSLTHKGLMISRLGEPLFLYLRIAHGWSNFGYEGALTPEVSVGDPPPSQ